MKEKEEVDETALQEDRKIDAAVAVTDGKSGQCRSLHIVIQG